MLGFEVVKRTTAPLWVPIMQGETIYRGQIVALGITNAGYGIKPLGAASGAGGVSADLVPWGIVTGFGDLATTYSSTYKTEYVAGVQSQANQVARLITPKLNNQVQGYSQGDPMPYAQVDRILPHTLIRGRIFNGAYGTAITAKSNTAQSTTGARVTTAAVAQTPIAYNATWTCISGSNVGLTRGTGNSTSTTQHDFDTYWPYDIEIGDTFKAAFVVIGASKMQTNSTAMYIEAEPDMSSNHWWVHVDKVNLNENGMEHMIFSFDPLTFHGVRA